MPPCTSSTLIPGEEVQIKVIATDNSLLSSVSVTINNEVKTLDANGQITFTSQQPGNYNLVITAVDGAGNISKKETLIRVTAPNDTVAPTLVIHSPAENSEITAPTDFVATISDDSLVAWKLSVQSISNHGISVIASGSKVANNEKIASFDPTLLMNGIYEVIFEAEDANGKTSSLITDVTHPYS